MDDCYRNLSRIPVSNIAAGLNLTDMEAVFDSAKVMSEPIGHKSYKGKTENGEGLQIEDLEIFENVAYVMAYHADNSISANIEDWLDQFNMFSIYEVLPQILELWGENLVTDVTSKKRLAEVSGK